MNAETMLLSRADAETFIYQEVELIDQWKLREWSALFTEDGQYLLPPLDQPDAQPGESLFLIYDDRHRLCERAKRLLKRTAHAEFPHSKVRHLIGNVRVLGDVEGYTRVACNFAVYRSRFGETQVFPGHVVYDLCTSDRDSIRMRRKRVILDTDSLRDQGRISLIL